MQVILAMGFYNDLVFKLVCCTPVLGLARDKNAF